MDLKAGEVKNLMALQTLNSSGLKRQKKFLDYQRLHQSDYQDKGLGVVFGGNDAIADRIFSFKNKVEADADCDVDRVADADRDAYADVNCSKRSKRN